MIGSRAGVRDISGQQPGVPQFYFGPQSPAPVQEEFYAQLRLICLFELFNRSRIFLPIEFHLSCGNAVDRLQRSEEYMSELQSHSFISYAVFCLKKQNK